MIVTGATRVWRTKAKNVCGAGENRPRTVFCRRTILDPARRLTTRLPDRDNDRSGDREHYRDNGCLPWIDIVSNDHDRADH